MRRIAISLGFALCASLTIFGQCTPLSTPMTGATGGAGAMFDLVNQGPSTVTIQSLDVHLLQGSWDLEIYSVTAGGGFAGHETVAGDWTLAGSASGVTSLGLGYATPVPITVNAAIASSQTLGFYVVCTNGQGLRYDIGTMVGNLLAQDGNLRILEGSGSSASFSAPLSPRSLNANIHYSVGASVWQLNQSGAWLDFSGNQATPCLGAITTRCANEAFTLNAASNVSGGLGEIAISYAPIVDATHPGAVPLADGQIINLDLSQPLIFFNLLGSTPTFLPMSQLNLSFSIGLPVTLSLQGFWLDGTSPSGVRCSQANQLDVVAATVTSVPGPSGDDSSASVPIAQSPQCWCSSGVIFFNQNYTTLHVSSNGRVVFNAGDSDFSPSISDALSDAPFIGFWTDLNPNAGGTINVSTPSIGSGIVRVDWSSVPYYGQSVSVSFGVSFDCNTGDVIIDGLQGIPANPTTTSSGDAQFLGLSPGVLAGASDIGITDWSLGSGVGTAPQMLYDWSATNAATGLVPSLQPAPPPYGQIVLSPVNGSYTWISF